MPNTATSFLPRRDALRAGAFLVGAGAVAAVTSCAAGSEPRPIEVDPLLDALAAARADAAAATAAIAFSPTRRDALTVISAERSAHADALAREVARLADRFAPTSTPRAIPAPPAAGAAPANGGSDAVRDALSRSARSAADLALSQRGYRAGLLGSISASCAVSAAVTLP